MMKTGFVFDESYFWYDSLNQAFPPFLIEPGGNPDRPDIKRRFYNLLSHSGLLKKLSHIEPRPATEAEILSVHSKAYYDSLAKQNSLPAGVGGEGAVFAEGGFDIAKLAAGGAITAVEKVLSGEVSNAYALVRPPGHHAETDTGAGFCILNNVALAAKQALQLGGFERVAIIDWDVHHGNGAQQIFWQDPSVLTISVHQHYSFLEVDTGTAEYKGEGAGEGYNINVPLPPGSGDVTYATVFDEVVIPALEAYQPQMIIVASGLDAGCYDPLGRMALTPKGFRHMASTVRQAAERLCEGRLVLCQEGGYDLASTPYMGLAVLEGLSAITLDLVNPFQVFGDSLGYTQEVLPHQAKVIATAIEQVRALAKA
ncbi:class II histone deacetylase [Dasania sp. GY-MA-18]|uniref:Class II histone deacetylase n=1 Tax=Dasania phycosphaerae TaxID=2950436 RepID=A0A9J6RNB8_9GAMM|nr:MULTISPECIES: class II histone deacetylase [Dasania]MCR8923215.1 class II histone deacetylase [Dasania sp. GY-MA-18]MCZ0865647.1 class II histone deacetylase [Dasania phycosphaerae]MCZ0869372.1 class II histone deacetylase [Dasania phycosphaerae]